MTAPPTTTDMCIRWMIRKDMPRVLEIEMAAWAQPWTRPWTEDDFIERLRQRNCIGMVAERSDRVVGFMVYELEKPRMSLVNFAVDPECWRQGVGTAMLNKVKSKCGQQRRREIHVVASEYNTAGHLFLRSQGFVASAVLRGFWEHQDGYLMTWTRTTDEAI